MVASTIHSPIDTNMKLDKSTVDYTVYLVTNNEIIPEGLDIYTQVEQAIRNGVTIVQLREKNLDTATFIKRAQKLHDITSRYNVPLIINDRVDVALAIDAEGVHVGQEDMPPAVVRKLIGPYKILGCTTHTEEEMMEAITSEANVDYVGIGATYPTNTKKVKSELLGIQGITRMLKVIATQKPDLKSVIIGGLNRSNIEKTLANCSYNGINTNGVAIVSCIMGHKDAGLATVETRAAIEAGFKSSSKS